MSAVTNITALPSRALAAEPDATGFEDMPLMMSPKVLAIILGVTVTSLERWRDQKRGPAFIRLPGSRMIRYSRADVIAWLSENRVSTEQS